MKYLSVVLLLLMFSCTSQHKEVDIDPLSKSYLLEHILVDIDGEQHAVFFMYPEFCGACTEEMVSYINSFSLDGYTICVVLTEENEITQTLSLPQSQVLVHDSETLQKHGLGFATGHLFLVEYERVIYSHAVHDGVFDLVDEEITSLLQEH